MDEEELNNKFSEYSDRQIVMTIIEELPKEDLEKLLIKLKENFG